MRNRKNYNNKPDTAQENESGIIAVCSGPEPGLYRFVSSAQKKLILRENAENRCREFRTDEISKAEDYLKRALDEAEARKFPLGYIAVRSGQFKGIYPYISAEERLKHMNKYHKYEIRDFSHFDFRKMAEIWADGFSFEETANSHLYKKRVLKKIYDSGNPAHFKGVISSVEQKNIFFEQLDIFFEDNFYHEENICIYHTDIASGLSAGQELSFSAEVYRYVTEENYIEYGIYELFDIVF